MLMCSLLRPSCTSMGASTVRMLLGLALKSCIAVGPSSLTRPGCTNLKLETKLAMKVLLPRPASPA